jgi:RNA polymerase sigma factor (sigma-70 family)
VVDPAAARRLWELYFARLLRLVNRKLPRHLRRAFDEEDVALSAFKSLCAGFARGRFPHREEGSLWGVLVVIAARKAQAYLRHHNRRKRGGGRVLGESAVRRPGDEPGRVGLEAILGDEPTPDFAAQVAEEYERLLAALGDEGLRTIAALKMQGYSVEEIAEQTGSTRRTIERRLQIIRRTWGEDEIT